MRSLLVALIIVAGVVPVAAAPNCLSSGSSSYPLDDDGKPSELLQLELDTMRLRGAGYKPLWVERWSGCIKVTYRDDGELVVEYLDPVSLEPVS